MTQHSDEIKELQQKAFQNHFIIDNLKRNELEGLLSKTVEDLAIYRNDWLQLYFSQKNENIEGEHIDKEFYNLNIEIYSSLIHDCNKLIDRLKEKLTHVIQGEKISTKKEQYQFSVLEWATIFYYADETKLLTESRLIKTRLEEFMSKHKVNTTFDNFKTKYYEAKRRINEKNDYPINKLELIIPFLKEKYKQTLTNVENDIIFLEENKPEY